MSLAARQYSLPISPLGALDYASQPGAWDEMLDPATGIRPHWTELVATLARFDTREWSARQQRIQRLLRENGVTYNVYDDPRGYSRAWQVDPVPLVLDVAEWLGIEAGLTQRARLLDLILRDLYGPRRLLREGLLPPELVFGHRGYLRPLVGALPVDRTHLAFYAADLARGPDGQVWVMADRCQSPSGAGYAIENRSVMARTFPELLEDGAVARLNPWLESVRAALDDMAPAATDVPRVVVLTPGPANETYFEHAYLAARLGYPLAQGDDLTVRDGRVWLKAVAGLRPVDVILRRVDEDWCDPLELRPESRLGTPGLVEAVRRGTVALANPLGAGVLENPALLPFLPAIAKALLGEDLRLPMAATWWCGQEKEREHVLAHLDQFAIKPIARGQASGTVFGPELDRAQLDAWRARIRAEPWRYVGQEILALSTLPTLDDDRLAARHASLRTFLARHGERWLALPGGLTRCTPGNMLSGQSGALSKDTWIVPVAHPTDHAQAPRIQAEDVLTSRAADNLFWAGRYLERAEAVARLLRVVLDGLWEEETVPGLGPVLDALMRLTGHPPGSQDCPDHGDVAACLRALVTRGDNPGDLAHTVRALLACAYATREHWSFAIWRLLNRLERDWGQGPRAGAVSRERTDLWLGRLIDTLAGLAGLASETLGRDPAFRFFDLGRRVERGLVMVGVIGEVLDTRLEGDAERECLSLVMQSMDSLIGFRRRYRAEPFLAGALEMLLWEADNPRSLIYQLHTGRRHLDKLPRPSRPAATSTNACEIPPTPLFQRGEPYPAATPLEATSAGTPPLPLCKRGIEGDLTHANQVNASQIPTTHLRQSGATRHTASLNLLATEQRLAALQGDIDAEYTPSRLADLRHALHDLRGALCAASDAVTHAWFSHIQEARALGPTTGRPA